MNFLDKTCKKMSKTEKSEHQNRILHIQNNQGTKFQLKLTFGANQPKKGISNLKNKRMKITIKFYMFELVYNPGQNIWNKMQ